MCSGCPGDYTGGFEDADDSNDGSESWGLAARSRPVDDGARDFTRVNDVLPAGVASTGISKETARHCWEVLVTDTCIVEVHRFGAARAEERQQAPGKMAEMAEVRNQSEPRSAKYYRTRGGRAEAMSHGQAVSCAGRERLPRGHWRKTFAMSEVKAFIGRMRDAIRKQYRRSARHASVGGNF